MKRIITAAIALMVSALCCMAQGPYSKYLAQAGDSPFIVIDKVNLVLTLADGNGDVLIQYPVACAVNYGPKTRRGDHKTPEGKFEINELLNARGLSHDFGDGKGPVPDAYGPWFLRLSVPGFRDIGIHGTPFPDSIGSRCTEGCIRLRNDDIKDLKSRVKLGTPVIILPDPPQE